MDAAGEAVVIGVDTGGTFTDIFASDGRVAKVPSTPDDPSRAILAGLHLVGQKTGDAVGHGTTVATNAVLERRGATTALITTAGFEDVLALRRQNRPSLYDLFARWPDPLVPAERRFGARERLDYRGEVLEPLTPEEVGRLIHAVRGSGAESVAICLLFSYANRDHELSLADALRARMSVSASHVLAPQYGEFERTSTTVLNAYVAPIMQAYLTTLRSRLGEQGVSSLHVMLSSGGLAAGDAATARPVSTLLSGPAAGVVGARVQAGAAGVDRIITLDMGGTSTDVALVDGDIEEVSEGEIAGYPMLIPMLLIDTVGAGGGSIARIDAAGGLHVGPESAGAVPGPAAYGHGELPTVTDADLVLGRLAPSGLLGGAMPLDLERSRSVMARLGARLDLSPEEAAWAVVRLANSNMDRAVRAVSLERGHDPRRFALFPFGGAGPLHGAEVAESLGIETVLVPPHPGVMAALGLTVPDLQREFRRTVLLRAGVAGVASAARMLDEMETAARGELGAETLFGAPVFDRFAFMRFVGQSFDLKVAFSSDVSDLAARFHEAYTRRYGYGGTSGDLEIAHLGLRATLPRRHRPALIPPWPEATPRAETCREVWFGSGTGVSGLEPVETPIRWRPALQTSEVVPGPAVIEQYDSTVLLPPGWRATVDAGFNLMIERS